MRLAFVWALAVATAGCDKDDGDTSGGPDDPGTSTGNDDATPTTGQDPDPEPPYWVVGEQGEMLRVDADGSVDRYPLDVSADLLGIACRGDHEAWVVGTAGTLLVTRDAGASWQHDALSSDHDLHAVAAADPGPIWVVGDGVAFVSHDDGTSFEPVDLPARSFTAVAVDHAHALVTDTTGAVWRMADDATPTVVHAIDRPLHGVAIAHDTAVAVGDRGTFLRSDDAGETFTAIPLPTRADLRAVQLADAGAIAIAVGTEGIVVEIDAHGTSRVTTIDPAITLHAVHLVDGHGTTLGEAGALFETFDRGLAWSAVALPTARTLHGVDHPGRHHD